MSGQHKREGRRVPRTKQEKEEVKWCRQGEDRGRKALLLRKSLGHEGKKARGAGPEVENSQDFYH